MCGNLVQYKKLRETRKEDKQIKEIEIEKKTEKNYRQVKKWYGWTDCLYVYPVTPAEVKGL